jgi:outer membrane cobalamin receptor
MLTAAVVLALLAGSPVGSPDSTAYWLDEIVVTATRSERAVARIPVSVSAISAPEIRSSNARSFADLLEGLPGVSVQRTGDLGRTDPIIRGLGDNGKRLLVLVDGRPEKMALFGCTVTHALPLGRVERVEVVRNALSHLYGSDAMGGVVNVLTAKPASPAEIGMRSTYGTHSTQIYQLSHGGQRSRFSYSLTADHRLSDGHVDNSAYRGTDLGGRFAVEPAGGVSVRLGGKWFDGRKYEPPPQGQGDTWGDVWNDYTRYGGDAAIDWSVGSGVMQTQAVLTGGEHRFSDGWHSRDRTAEGRVEFRRNLPPGGDVLVGVSARHQWGQRLGASPWEGGRAEVAAYVQADLLVGKRSRSTLGMRYAVDSKGNAALAPAAAALWQVSPRVGVRASATTGFRFPQLGDLYLFPPSNPALDPERSLDLELGATARLSRGSTFEAAVFQRELWGLIETVPREGAPPWRYENEGRGTLRGLEGSIRGRPLRWLEISAAYTHLDPGARTMGRVRSKADLRFRAGTARCDCGLSASQVWGAYAASDGEGRLPDYLLVGVKGTVRVGWGLDLIAAVDNLLDEDYLVYAALPGSGAGAYEMPGRRFTVGVSLDYPGLGH